MQTTDVFLADEAEMVQFGASLVSGLNGRRWQDELVFLSGDLGAGKTTLVRGFVQGLGHRGAVKSPTYTLVEPYTFDAVTVYHFDFYRIKDPRELSYMGIDELMQESAVKLVEWPEQAGNKLPPPDIDCRIVVEGTGRRITIEDRRG